LQKEFYKKDSNWNIITQTRNGIDLEQMDAFERFGAVKLIFWGKESLGYEYRYAAQRRKHLQVRIRISHGIFNRRFL
jgi:hypothetical protein